MTFISCSDSPKHRHRIKHYNGTCLEKLGLSGKGHAIIFQTAKIKVGDVVYCSRTAGQIGGYLKQVKEINGDSIIVGTACFDDAKNFQFEAAEIFGVVLETYDSFFGHREYKRGGVKQNEITLLQVQREARKLSL